MVIFIAQAMHNIISTFSCHDNAHKLVIFQFFLRVFKRTARERVVNQARVLLGSSRLNTVRCKYPRSSVCETVFHVPFATSALVALYCVVVLTTQNVILHFSLHVFPRRARKRIVHLERAPLDELRYSQVPNATSFALSHSPGQLHTIGLCQKQNKDRDAYIVRD